MKKTGFLLLIATLVTLLAGCSSAGGYTEPEEIATVSAIGVDVSENGVRVSMQIAFGGEKSAEVVSGDGESVEFALSHLSGAGHKRKELSHCALIAIGKGVEGEILEELFGLCRENDDIPDTVLIVATHNAFDLLSLEDAMGYDLAATMKPSKDRAGLFSKNRFYELDSNRDETMALPFFSVSNETYDLHGLKLYKDMKERVLLDRKESGMYLMARGIFSSGQIDYETGGRVLSVGVAKVRTEMRREDDGIIVSCLLVPSRRVTEEKAGEIESSLKDGAERMMAELIPKYGDILEMGASVYKFEFEVIG